MIKIRECSHIGTYYKRETCFIHAMCVRTQLASSLRLWGWLGLPDLHSRRWNLSFCCSPVCVLLRRLFTQPRWRSSCDFSSPKCTLGLGTDRATAMCVWWISEGGDGRLSTAYQRSLHLSSALYPCTYIIYIPMRSPNSAQRRGQRLNMSHFTSSMWWEGPETRNKMDWNFWHHNAKCYVFTSEHLLKCNLITNVAAGKMAETFVLLLVLATITNLSFSSDLLCFMMEMQKTWKCSKYAMQKRNLTLLKKTPN